MNIGIVGLPNVGKSTIFNALTRSTKAQTANYAFCTIDPNKGIVEVPDKRLKNISEIVKPEKITPTTIEFVDIAGLVKGASKGEGLGNKFLSHIRECDAIAEVMRFFDDPDVMHVRSEIDPKDDLETIQIELILADLQTVEKRLEKAKSDAKSGEKSKIAYANLMERLAKTLGKGELAHAVEFQKDECAQLKDLHLLTMKPFLYIANLSEEQIQKMTMEDLHRSTGIPQTYDIIPICAKIEEELSELPEEEAKEFLYDLGLNETGLHHLIQTAYQTLQLETFFTAGPKEVRAWTVRKGSSAPKAAGRIHTDFEKGFIKAEVTSYEDFIANGSEAKAREKGLVRQEGKDYIVRDGDIIYFRFNV